MVALNSIVLATGGGIIIEEENRELLASRGTVFYLHTPLNTQVERTAKDKDRPLLKDQILRKSWQHSKNQDNLYMKKSQIT
jgi:shikimate kinase